MICIFIEFDNQLFKQGLHNAVGGTFLSIYQALGVGLEGADGVIKPKRTRQIEKLYN